MTPLIGCIALLPADLVGSYVFAFLPLASLVRFDLSVSGNPYRCTLEEALAYSAVCVLGVGDETLCRRKLWQWCAMRRVTVKELQFSNVDVEEVAQLRGVLRRVPRDGLVHWNCDITADRLDGISCILRDKEISGRIDHLRLYKSSGGDVLKNMWENLRQVTTLLLAGTHHSEQTLSQILLARIAVQDIVLHQFSFKEATTMHAFGTQAETLTSLLLSEMSCHPLFLTVIGQSCVNLRNFEMRHYNKPDVHAWVTEAGLLAIAQGCRKLELFTVSNITCVTEAVLLALTAYCPDLSGLSCYGCASLTDAVLLALSAGCLNLRGLVCTPWAIKSIRTVEDARLLFSRLTTCPINCSYPTSPTVVANIAGALRNATELSLTNATAAHLAALPTELLARFQTISLHSALGVRVAADNLVLAAAASNANMRSLHLREGCTVTEDTLLTLAALCPGFTNLGVEYVAGGVAESALIAVVSSWPKLRCINICKNVSFTDAVLRAIAQHCPRLNWLELRANTAVSESALLALAERGGFVVLAPPASFSPESQKRIMDAHSAARRARRPQ
jgi:hypothetical protein